MKTRPTDYVNPSTEQHPCVGKITHLGLTKREYFAAMALQGLLANRSLHNDSEFAACSVIEADKLIAELNKDSK